MTRYKMPKQPQDDTKSDTWSMSFLSSTGGGVRKFGGGAIALFDLFNRTTNRAHVMTITATGKVKGLPVGMSFRNSGYAKFKTNRPANFPDFHDKRAKLELKDRLGKSWRTITIYEADGRTELMSVEVNNFNLTGWHSFKGTGTTEVYYSDGKPVGDPDYDLNFQHPKRSDFGPDRIQIRQTDYQYVFRLPGDVLFDFDRDWLHYQASQAVSDTMDYINSIPEDYRRIRVEGHTDSKEKVPGYNLALSRRRAKTVLDYLRKYKGSLNKEYFFDPPMGFGAQRPIAPNTHPDGSDNPEGREKNRRVEILLYKK